MADLNPGGQVIGPSGGQAVGLSGIVVVDKPPGITSHDVVNRIRRLFGTKRVGHTGTLDPLATGVLALCVGPATRIAEYLTADSKEYIAGVRFGLTTDSGDVTGQTIAEGDSSLLTESAVHEALPQFRGKVAQTPPMVSAVHHEGKRLYELARAGVEVERKPREIEIHRLDLISFEPGARAEAIFEIECSSGTYIRTLVADIGTWVGTGATMMSLRRTRSGNFTIAAASSLEELELKKGTGDLNQAVHPIAEALAGWPQIQLSGDEVDRIIHGQSILRDDVTAELGSRVLLLNGEQVPISIGALQDGNVIAPTKVFISGS